MQYYIIFIVTIAIVSISSARVDLTLQPKQTGVAVTQVVLDLLKTSKIFPSNDQFFLQRIALVESKYGQLNHTFGENFYGGIWQLSKEKYETTKHKDFSKIHEKILENFGINWIKTKWEDLLQPLFSALAARLYLHYLMEPKDYLPGDIKEQAKLWHENYTVSNFTIEEFEKNSYELEATVEISKEKKVDLCILMDRSDSITPKGFQTALNLVSKIVNYICSNLNQVNIAFLVFDHQVSKIFDFNHNFSEIEMQQKISETKFLSGGAYLNKGIF